MGSQATIRALMKVALLSPALVIACSRSLSKEEIDRLVDNRLAERGFPQPGPSASASAALPSSQPVADSNPLVAASVTFLDRLDELMKGYEPELPSVVDNADSLRCVSAYSAQNEPRLKDLVARAATEKKSSLAAREKAKREFRNRVRPLNVDFA